MNNDPRYTNHSSPSESLTERSRRVEFRGSSPLEEWFGRVEIMCGADGTMCLSVDRSHRKKSTGTGKWHTTSSYVTISAGSWEFLMSAPTVFSPPVGG